MIVIISDDSKDNWGAAFEETLLQTESEVFRFSSNKLDIKPCAACGSCSGKTYGRCIIPDDMQQVLVKIAGCCSLILISPIVFGGVSHHIKKIMDRMASIGDPRYRINKGEIVKGMSGQGMNYYMVGTGNNISEAEKSAFLYLHEENINIMSAKGRAFVLDKGFNRELINKTAQEILHE
ncbi:MAG: flavodoxin family protein [Christensenellaceae bacterium]|nr:flavodoxin family protein [Christensenellaceae bacterium]